MEEILAKQKKENTEHAAKLRIIPLGGLEQIGMNITAFEYEDSIVVVDCGLAFPEDDMYGIDLVIPDVTYLEENIDKVKGFVITHGHEDHIGSLPYVLKKINVPVYGTRLTMGIIEHKLGEHDMLGTTRRKVVKFGQTVTLGKFKVEFIKTNHSIVDAAALAITSPVGTVIHTGDFKVDYTPVYGDAIDLQRFAELGKKGVLALLCDSTNSERPGFTQSEKTVGKTIDRLFQEHKDTRIIIATFASNVDRVQQIINSAYKYGRKVVVEGRSMVNIIDTASKLGCLNVPDNTLIEVDQLKNYPERNTVIITT
ncbi:MAG: ribonuclease J, partial [Clostridia bacterium]|nr:ribonuclease J [Clostridia bacterium]